MYELTIAMIIHTVIILELLGYKPAIKALRYLNQKKRSNAERLICDTISIPIYIIIFPLIILGLVEIEG